MLSSRGILRAVSLRKLSPQADLANRTFTMPKQRSDYQISVLVSWCNLQIMLLDTEMDLSG